MDPVVNEVSALLLVYTHRNIFPKLTSYVNSLRKSTPQLDQEKKSPP